ncbi:MAG: hypothetical protein KJ000_11925 [Pirellulaceae bacterium]|nr:hypothetical protein [Pirellulaceae bacterium]
MLANFGNPPRQRGDANHERFPAVAMSGVTEGFSVPKDESTVLLRKPFGQAELLYALQRLLRR